MPRTPTPNPPSPATRHPSPATRHPSPATSPSGLVLLAAALLGWTAGCMAAVTVHRATFLPPEPKDRKVRVVIDRTVSDVPLGRGAFSEGPPDAAYGLLEQWIGRLGYVTQRRRGPEVLDGDMVVVLCPHKSVSEEFREGLVRYVEGGGRLLVIDDVDNARTTANSLLWPFGLSVHHDTGRQGLLNLAGWPVTEVGPAGRTEGGTPFLSIDGVPVAARQRYGQGEVMVLGCGAAFDDASLGAVPDESCLITATPAVRARSDMLFAIVRALATGQPIAPPPQSWVPSPKGRGDP